MGLKLPKFASDYFEEWPDLFEQIKQLEIRRSIKVFRKIANETNEINFYSWLSEMKFGLLFDRFSTKLLYEKSIDSKTPDWTIIINDQTILAEVLRLNPSEAELLHRHNQGKQNRHRKSIIMSSTKVLSSQWLYGHQTKIEKKITSYSDTIFKNKAPFIICAATTLDTFLDDLDFFDFFIGHNKKGFFYSNKEFGQHITGILLKTYYNDTIYFQNELALYKISDENANFFQDFRYSGK